MRLFTFLLSFALLASAGLVQAQENETFVLPYQKQNEWVAVADNAPLRALIDKVKAGQQTFYVALPDQNRELSVKRLLILMDILKKYAPAAVNITEANGVAEPNTLVLHSVAPTKTPDDMFNAAASN